MVLTLSIQHEHNHIMFSNNFTIMITDTFNTCTQKRHIMADIFIAELYVPLIAIVEKSSPSLAKSERAEKWS